MASLKCKMCGADIIAAEGQTCATCDHCGNAVTLPAVNNPQTEKMFNRANQFRMEGEFDKAAGLYETILDGNNTDAEAHWGLLLSRHGVEYVEEPVSHRRIPVCRHSVKEPVLSDPDYLSALAYAPDAASRSIYEAEGKRLSELQCSLLQMHNSDAANAQQKKSVRKKSGRKVGLLVAAVAVLLVVAVLIGTCCGFNAKKANKINEMFAVGNYVTFGTYPQTAEGGDATPIEWLVLDRDGDKALLLSRYALDVQPYNERDTSITWENCTLRTWLNDDFIDRAFTAEEQSAILLTNVDNSDSQGFDFTTVNEYAKKVTGGNNTQDKIFLLSYAEANKYLGVTYGDYDNTQSRVAPTAYAIAQSAYTKDDYKTADGEAAGWWWLRSPGDSHYGASCVSSGGSLYNYYVICDNFCVRPALWVNLESGIF